MPSFAERIQQAVSRMDDFQCECDAIAETHRKRDCTPMWHRMSWHGETVRAVATIAEARARYPLTCDHIAR